MIDERGEHRLPEEIDKSLRVLCLWQGGLAEASVVPRLTAVSGEKDHHGDMGRLGFVRFLLRYLSRHARVQPSHYAGWTVRQLLREQTETSEDMRREYEASKRQAAARNAARSK